MVYFLVGLSDRPTMQLLLKIVRDKVCAASATMKKDVWYELGLLLMDDDPNANDALLIIEENNNSLPKRCQKMFQWWINSDLDASWTKLLSCLKQQGGTLRVFTNDLESAFHNKMDKKSVNKSSDASMCGSNCRSHIYIPAVPLKCSIALVCAQKLILSD